jgi:2,3-bisphosphoglycerate-dependent phosphoglycerate mutase
MPQLILVRHGQSEWNLQNKFTGWVDVDLTKQGEDEARNAGELLKDYSIDNLFTSVLNRAIKTADIILKELGSPTIPTERDEALNERHYGDLQGQNKEEIGEKYGQEQLHIWRRSYDIAPPGGESLLNTRERVITYYKEKIEPLLKQGKNVMVVAHGNSLRALVMYLENISKEEIPSLNIPTGTPYVYDLDVNLYIKNTKYLEKE